MNCSNCVTTTSAVTTTTLDPTIVIENILSNWYNGSTFFITGIFSAIALPMSVVTILVFSLSPCGTSKTTRVYYITIAICELSTGVIRDILTFFVGNGIVWITNGASNFQIVIVSTAACQVIDFLQFGFEMICTHMYVVLAAERCLALYLPLKFHLIVGRNRAIGCVFGLATIAFLTTSCTLAGADVYVLDSEGNPIDCNIQFTGLLAGQFAVAMLLLIWPEPTFSALVLNAAIIAKLRAIMKSEKTLHASGTDRGESTSRKQTEVTMTLVIMTALHVIIYIPMAIMRVTPLLLSLGPGAPSIFNASRRLVYPYLSVTHTTNFIIYWRRVKGFKENVKNVLHCRRLIQNESELKNK